MQIFSDIGYAFGLACLLLICLVFIFFIVCGVGVILEDREKFKKQRAENFVLENAVQSLESELHNLRKLPNRSAELLIMQGKCEDLKNTILHLERIGEKKSARINELEFIARTRKNAIELYQKQAREYGLDTLYDMSKRQRFSNFYDRTLWDESPYIFHPDRDF